MVGEQLGAQRAQPQDCGHVNSTFGASVSPPVKWAGSDSFLPYQGWEG